MKDLLIDDNLDLRIENGDFVVGESSLQHQYMIINSQKGEWKESPELGVGIDDEILNENPRRILNRMRRNLEYDGATVRSLEVLADGQIYVDAIY